MIIPFLELVTKLKQIRLRDFDLKLKQFFWGTLKTTPVTIITLLTFKKLLIDYL